MNLNTNVGGVVAGNLISTTSAPQGGDFRHAVNRLVAFLNGAYATGEFGEYEIAVFNHYQDDHDERTWIELPDDIVDHPLALRAIATLVVATGGASWPSGRFTDVEPPAIPGPLRFSLAKRSAWFGDGWWGSRFAVVDNIGGNPGGDEQVDALIQHLQNQENLVQLTADDLSLF